MPDSIYTLGIDIGSTTVKTALLDKNSQLLFSDYRRHHANIQTTLLDLLKTALDTLGDMDIRPCITGSGGLSLAGRMEIPFIQEVIAVSEAIESLAPKTDVAIELGGEDAKIIYFENGHVEQRMNGICAGGTGSFIDQMATLLNSDAEGLNEYAKNYGSLYPIAARCGVFAKTDIQPLINEGATKEDLSASIFQAVVNQTISGLACGKPIKGHILFLGGPLHFLSELREAFIRTLKLDNETALIIDNSHLFAAIGAALSAAGSVCHSGCDLPANSTIKLSAIVSMLENGVEMEAEISRMEPLFVDSDEYDRFLARHDRARIGLQDLNSYRGNCFLGIDAGSTTTKLALISSEGKLLYSFYSNNEGSPVKTAAKAIVDIYNQLPEGAVIARCCSTGYGEALMKSAFMLDEGDVETVAHYTAAAFFEPEVECILDIGGQDMKCIKIKDGCVDSVMLNEACSSGCGSFIETFAASLKLSVQDFALEAIDASNPIDLGTRCTVFMNSNVKQAQKEGATVADISAGLAYSVIKNALFKVIKVSNASELGKRIVVQGGTFLNPAVLRAFEKIADCQVIRPNIAGLMGALGAALIARDNYIPGEESTILDKRSVENLVYQTSMTNCRGCNNSCRLTINTFNGGRRFISGNRCERGLGIESKSGKVANLYEYKLKRLFSYTPLAPNEAPRGTVGIPRVLNMYENYPFWFRFFTDLGYSVLLSPPSSKYMYSLGIESIPSESVCYPAKLVHGHVQWLINNNPDFIFYPSVFYERNEFPEANNHYNCPIVTSYSENIKNNIEDICSQKVKFLNPFIAFTNEETVYMGLKDSFPDISDANLKKAIHAGFEELDKITEDIHQKGEEVIQKLAADGGEAIVLAGRPYHLDPEINHGIPELITSYGITVLTEDSICHLEAPARPLIVSDQWMYHSRLYAAASYVKTTENINLIQLNSFGCGLDAITTDQVSDILTSAGKLYTCLKIDEVNNLGAVRIRIRSLISALETKKRKGAQSKTISSPSERVGFTKEMKEKYTILVPQLSPVHFDIMIPALGAEGYNVVTLDNDNKEAVNTGLKYVNNDACYPSLLVVGQIMDALLSGKYDLNKTAVIMTQTGGGCRATNYIGFIRRALKKAGLSHIPVISLNLGSIEVNSGFKITPSLAYRAALSASLGDILQKCILRMKPYEKEPGSVEKLHQLWKERCVAFISKIKPEFKEYRKLCRQIIEDFDHIPIVEDNRRPRVGIVGEILVKYSPAGNNHLIELLEKEGAEAVCPELIGFMHYCFYNQIYKSKHLGGSKKTAAICSLGIKALEFVQAPANRAFKRSRHFDTYGHIGQLAEYAKEFVSIGNQTGEGWFLVGEMIELIRQGSPNIVCCQPFGCLPNHVVGKGVIKSIRKTYPEANIVAIDYDPGASEVNQLNRIKLMLSTAFKNTTT